MDRHYHHDPFEDEEYEATSIKKLIIIESSDHASQQL